MGESNELNACTPKLQESDCEKHQKLKLSQGLESDNECYTPGRCLAGSQVAADKVTCMNCPVGKFNDKYTVSQTACTDKKKPGECQIGQYLLLGLATTRNDWRCSQCKTGQYAAGKRAVNGNDPSVQECTAKVKPPPCHPTVEFLEMGTSAKADDWVCRSLPSHVSMCVRETKSKTRSGLAGVQVGMPELVSPFTKEYVASVKTPGYSRQKTRAVVVVTGDRYVSDQERVALPKSKPLMVVHDPPGGNSFSAFINAYATFGTLAYEEADAFVRDNEGTTAVGLGFEVANDTPLPETIVAPGGGGISINVNYAQVDFFANRNLGLSMAETFELRSDAESGSSNLAKDEYGATFSYSTSADVNGAGPSSDAFLVRVGSVLVWGRGWLASKRAGWPVCYDATAPPHALVG